MSNAAQTWTIVGATVALISLVIGIMSFWVSRSLDRIEAELREMRTVLMREHGERIARLEERLPRA